MHSRSAELSCQELRINVHPGLCQERCRWPDCWKHGFIACMHACCACRTTFITAMPCDSDNQAARNCIAKAEANSPAAKSDPYLRLTHANIIMNMLPKGRFSSLKDAEKAKHSECIHKVCVCVSGCDRE